MQYRLIKAYLKELNSDQTLVMESGHPLGLFASGPEARHFHTHLIFGGYRAVEFAWRLKGVSCMEIMERGGGTLTSVAATRQASLEGLIASGRQRLDAILVFGVTTVEGRSCYGLDREIEIRQLEAMAALDGSQPVDIVLRAAPTNSSI
jgi:imidazolonepropionase-like amidohydrolase